MLGQAESSPAPQSRHLGKIELDAGPGRWKAAEGPSWDENEARLLVRTFFEFAVGRVGCPFGTIDIPSIDDVEPITPSLSCNPDLGRCGSSFALVTLCSDIGKTTAGFGQVCLCKY